MISGGEIRLRVGTCNQQSRAEWRRDVMHKVKGGDWDIDSNTFMISVPVCVYVCVLS